MCCFNYCIAIFSLLCFLVPTVFTGPVAPSSSQSGSQSLSLPGSQVNETSILSEDHAVWGPKDFVVSTNRRATTLDGPFMLAVTVDAVSQLAALEFDGNLPESRMRFRREQSPGMEISIAGIRGSQLKTKYALWGMARAAHYIIKDGFPGTLATMRYQGQDVGSIWFIATSGPVENNAASSNQTGFSTGSTNITATSINVPGLTWRFTKRDIVPDQMTNADVAMGAIGALNTVSPQTGAIQHFVSSLVPEYNVVYFFFVHQRPSRLNKSIAIATILAEYEYMTANNYFKALNTQVMLNRETICEGVVMGNPLHKTSSSIAQSWLSLASVFFNARSSLTIKCDLFWLWWT